MFARRVDRILLAVLLLEATVIVSAVAWRFYSPRPPLVDLDFLDPLTADEIESRREPILDGDQSPQNWFELGRQYLLNGFFPESELCFRQAAESDPESFNIRYYWALSLDRIGRMDQAIEQFQQASRRAGEKERRECLYHIGRNCLRNEDVPAAERAFRQIEADMPAARYELARLLLRDGRPEQALRLLDQQIATGRADQHHWYQLRARAYDLLNQTASAVADRELAERLPGQLVVHRGIKFLMDQSKRFGWKRALERGNQLAESDRLKAAMRQLEKVVAADAHRDAVSQLAGVLLKRNQEGRAVKLLDELIDRDGPLPELLALLGYAFEQQGNTDAARIAWEWAVRLRPIELVHRKLADYYEENGQAEAAKRHRAASLFERGVAAFRTNQLQAAVDALQTAADIRPEDTRVRFYLAESYRHLGRHRLAAAAYHRNLKTDPGHWRSRQGLKRLEAPAN